MNAMVDAGWALVVDASLKAALAAIVAWAALALWRPRNASARHSVWTAALAASLALPALTLVAPRVNAPAGWYPRLTSGAPAARNTSADRAASGNIRESFAERQNFAATAMGDANAAAVDPATSAPPTYNDSHETQLNSASIGANQSEPSVTNALTAPAPLAARRPSNVATDSVRLSAWRRVGLAIYLAGAAVMAARFFAGLWTTRRLIAQARAVDLPPGLAKLPPGARILESDAVRVPVAAGLMRPAVILPADWPAWNESLLACVLAHEGAHIRRRDTWVAMLAAVNRVLYWFHPASFVIQRRLATLAEQVCDDAVIEATGTRADYARGLLEMAGRVSRGFARVAPAGVAMARRANVDERIDAIIDAGRPLARRLGRWRLAALAMVAAPVVLLAAGLRAAVQVVEPTASSPQVAADAAPEDGPADAQPGADANGDAVVPPALAGRIVDDLGRPATDVEINLSGPDYLSSKTDADGRYKFDRIEQAGEYRLMIESMRWVGFTRRNEMPVLQLAPGAGMVRDFELQRACVVRLRAVDEAGQPIDGIRVLAMPASGDSMDWPNGLITHGAQTENGGWAEVGLPRSAQPYHLATMGDGYAFARIGVKAEDPSVTQLLSITLVRGAEVRGTAICSDGKPAAGWFLQVVPTWWNFTTSPKYAPIDAQGSFLLPHVTPGRYHVSIAVPTGDGTTRVSRVLADVELPPPGGVLELKINEPSPQGMGAIAGSVKFVGGTPAQGVSIYAVSEAGGVTGHGDVARDLNTFRVYPVPPGRYRVRFSAPDIEEKVLNGVTAPVDDLEVELQYVARPKLRGLVTLADGSPATTFAARVEKVRTLRGDNFVVEPQWREIENAAGEFEIEVPGPGVYRLVARAEGYAATRSAEINTDEYDGQPVPLTLNAGAALTGTVVDDQGAPINGARVAPLSGYASAYTRQAVDIESAGVATDEQGRFRLEQLTPGQELLRVSHPDFSFRTVPNVSLKAGDNQTEPIALSRGGKVVGRVFDAQGRPQPGVQLSIRNRSGWSETAYEKLTGEFAVVTTDLEGRYEADHLPAELCYAVRNDPWSALGVVRHAILPANGATRTLDLGGERAVRGRLLVNGAPVASTRIQLGDHPSFGAFQAYAMTDAEGRFAFWSPAPGKRTLYYAAPGRRNDWVVAAKLSIAPGAADVGDLDVRTSTVAIAVRGLSEEDAAGARVALEAYDPNWLMGDDGGIPQARAGAGEPFVFTHVLPGEYEAAIGRPDGVTLLHRVTVPASGERVTAEVVWPAGASSVQGPLNDAIFGLDEGVYSPLTIWKKDGTMLKGLYRDPSNKFEIKGLPAGEYFVTSFGTRNPPPALEFTLAPGEEKTLDLIAGGFERQVYAEGALFLRCYGEDGVPLPGCEITLERDGVTLTPHSSQEGRVVFAGPAGTYRMTAKFPGMETVVREVTLTSQTPEGRAAGESMTDVWMRVAQ